MNTRRPSLPTLSEVFGNDLQPDPLIALQPIQIPARSRPGPSPRLQFVIEFVGPRSISAGLASVLLSPDWQKALGAPQVFAMSAADVEWRPLTDTKSGSYDSLALAWDLLAEKGQQLSKQSAQHLLRTSEGFAEQVQRRAMPMPVPEDIPKAISQLKKVLDNFDAGVSLMVLPDARKVSEYELWVWCAKLGLTPNLSEGTFDWLVPSSQLPLFSVSPVGETESFTLQGAQRGDTHQGVLLGFSVPRSPEPVGGLEGMLRATGVLAQRMPGTVFDENNRALTEGTTQTTRNQLAEAVATLTKLGFPPGSSESLKLFASN